jgi:uncharacterized protein YraI
MRMRSLAVAFVLAFALPAAAEAFEAITTGAVNVRSGAGTKFSRLATLPRGTSVSVGRCDRGWCAIEADDVSGWVSARYLAGLGESGGGGVTPYRPPSIIMPTVPPPVTPLVVPRKDYHYYGYSRQHKFQRPFD